MKKIIGIFAGAVLTATGASAAELTPYVGLGIVADQANTSAKRMGMNKTPTGMADMFVQDAGGDMDFDMAIAGEVTAGVKYGSLRAELEFAMRSAAEDDYNLYAGDMAKLIGIPSPVPVNGTIDTSTSVKHNSYMANFYYDFDIAGSKWQPYVGAGLGVGTYKQKAKINVDFDADVKEAAYKTLEMMGITIPDMHITKDRTAFEWQVAVGTAYHFTPNWAADIAYRFNSSTISGEFVYAHELKLGARYSF